MSIPTFIETTGLKCDAAADKAVLDAVRAELEECSERERKAIQALQMAHASLYDVMEMMREREIVAVACERYTACNQAVNNVKKQVQNLFERIRLIEECIASDEYRRAMDVIKRHAANNAAWAQLPEDVRKKCGLPVQPIKDAPFAVEVGTIMACSNKALEVRLPDYEYFISVYVLSATEDTYCVRYLDCYGRTKEEFVSYDKYLYPIADW